FGPKVGIMGASAVGLRAQARPPGTEFLDAETGRQKSSPKCPTATETKIRELSGRKSPQKRPILRRIENARFAETGWWRHSGTNWRPTTQSSNRSLKSESGTEFFDEETEGQIRLFCLAETDAETGRYRKSSLSAGQMHGS